MSVAMAAATYFGFGSLRTVQKNQLQILMGGADKGQPTLPVFVNANDFAFGVPPFYNLIIALALVLEQAPLVL